MKKIINLRESGKFLKNNLFPLKTMKNRTPVRDLKEKFGCGLLKKSYYFSFLKNGLRIAQQEESGGLVFGVVQRLPNGIIRPE